MPVKEGHCMWSAKTGIFVCLFVCFYGNFKIQEKGHPSLFIYLVTTAVQFSFILCGWLRMFILLFHFVFTSSKFVWHDQCHNLSLLFRGVNYAAAASYSYASPWSLALRHQSPACDLRVTRVSRSPPRLRRRRLMQQYLVARDCFLPSGSWLQRAF